MSDALNKPQDFSRVITPPAREHDGEFSSFETWVNKAASWIGGTNPLCVDALDRRCLIGKHFQEARDEGQFPVRFWYGEGGQTPAEQRKAKTNREKALRLMYPWRYK